MSVNIAADPAEFSLPTPSGPIISVVTAGLHHTERKPLASFAAQPPHYSQGTWFTCSKTRASAEAERQQQ